MSTQDKQAMTGPDELKLAQESTRPPGGAAGDRFWKVLIVDDEDEVHSVTRLALDGFEYAGRKLQLISAYSCHAAKEIIAANNDIALILLDVVMETDQAGLDVARYIRRDIRNKFVRIVLRTGMPGQAPEHKVITDYDINDYKEKTELTRQKLFTTVYTSLSSYRDLMALEGNRRGLEKVIAASAKIFELRSIEHFAQGVLEQLTSLLYLDQDAIVVAASGLAADGKGERLIAVAATGQYESLIGKDIRTGLNATVLARIGEVMNNKKSSYGNDYYVGYYKTESGDERILYMSANTPINVPDLNLIEMFSRNVAIAHENVRLLSGSK